MSRNKEMERYLHGNDREDNAVLNTLYEHWIEDDPICDERIRSNYRKLGACIAKLELNQIDQIDDLVTDLCMAYSRGAFLAGLRTGVRLAAELFGGE